MPRFLFQLLLLHLLYLITLSPLACFAKDTTNTNVAKKTSNKVIASDSNGVITKIVTLKGVTFTSKNQIELNLSDSADFKVFVLEAPNRLVVDLKPVKFASANYAIQIPTTLTDFISNARTSKDDDGNARIVFDLKQDLNLYQVKMEKPAGDKNLGSKLIINLIEPKQERYNSAVSNSIEQITKPNNNQSEEDIAPPKPTEGSDNLDSGLSAEEIKINKRTPIIIIDAGHGGKDPGAIGSYARTKEKNVTLSYARELKKKLEATNKYKVYLTRGKDFFIPLKERVQKSRKLKADLFISLHANIANDSEVSGLSIYTLSKKSSDKQAELLAQKENRADIISDVNFSNASEDILKTMIDLAQRDSMNKSADFANIAIKSAKKSGIEILQNTHRFAGFAVLTAPDMASVLIELGYLSNKREENLLNDLLYKRKISDVIASAIDEYFTKVKL